MVLSKSLKAYALVMHLLYIGEAIMSIWITALLGTGKFDLKIGIVT